MRKGSDDSLDAMRFGTYPSLFAVSRMRSRFSGFRQDLGSKARLTAAIDIPTSFAIVYIVTFGFIF